MKNKKPTIQPLLDRVLVKEIESKDETKTKSGIILLAQNEDKTTKRGEVVAVGKTVKAEVKKGDAVVFSWGDKINIEGVEYFVVKESELIAVIN